MRKFQEGYYWPQELSLVDMWQRSNLSPFEFDLHFMGRTGIWSLCQFLPLLVASSDIYVHFKTGRRKWINRHSTRLKLRFTQSLSRCSTSTPPRCRPPTCPPASMLRLPPVVLTTLLPASTKRTTCKLSRPATLLSQRPTITIIIFGRQSIN